MLLVAAALIVQMLGLRALIAVDFFPFPYMSMPIVGVAALLLVRELAKRRRMHQAPWKRRLAHVVHRREHAIGDREGATRSSFATLEFENGAREELELHGPLAHTLAPDDIGIAFSKGDQLIEFKRLRDA